MTTSTTQGDPRWSRFLTALTSGPFSVGLRAWMDPTFWYVARIRSRPARNEAEK